MKILSVNREYTEGENEIAFNLDRALTPELMALVSYGSLELLPRGTVLIVKKKGGEPFTPEFVANLEVKLDAAEDTLTEARSKRLETQASLARRLKLPLG